VCPFNEVRILASYYDSITQHRSVKGIKVQCTVLHTYLSRPGFVLDLDIKPKPVILQWVPNMEEKHSSLNRWVYKIL
jgi:hypothetical protein